MSGRSPKQNTGSIEVNLNNLSIIGKYNNRFVSLKVNNDGTLTGAAGIAGPFDGQSGTLSLSGTYDPSTNRIISAELSGKVDTSLGSMYNQSVGLVVRGDLNENGLVDITATLNSSANLDLSPDLKASIADTINSKWSGDGTWQSFSVTLDAHLEVVGIKIIDINGQSVTLTREEVIRDMGLGMEFFGGANPFNLSNLPAPHPTHCFPSDTRIHTANQNSKAINIVQIGDFVLAFDPKANSGRGDLVTRRVTRLFRNITQEWLNLSNGMTVTARHRFLNEFGAFEEAQSICARGGFMVKADGSFLKVTAERIVYSEQTRHLYEEVEELSYASAGNTALAPQMTRGWRTYNFEVEELHTYIAGGIRVHNDSLTEYNNLAANVGTVVGQNALESQYGSGALTAALNPTSGLIKCGVCGENYAIRNAKQYCCHNFRSKGTCQNSNLVDRHQLEQLISDALRQQLAVPETIQAAIREMEASTAKERAGAGSVKAKLTAKLGKTKNHIERILSAISETGHSKALISKLNDLEAETETVNAELVLIDDAVAPLPKFNRESVEAGFTKFLQHLPNVFAMVEDPRVQRTREMIRNMVGKIIVTPKPNGATDIAIHGSIVNLMVAAGVISEADAVYGDTAIAAPPTGA